MSLVFLFVSAVVNNSSGDFPQPKNNVKEIAKNLVMDHNSNIKSMKLYNNVDRIYNELKELGKTDSDPLHVDEFSNIEFLINYIIMARKL